MKFSIALIASVAVGATALPNIAPAAQHHEARAVAPAHEKRGILSWLGARQGPDGQEGQEGGFGGQQSESAGPRSTGGFGGGQKSRSGGFRPTGGFGGQQSHSAGPRPTGGRGGFGGQQSQSFGAQPTGAPSGEGQAEANDGQDFFPGAGQQSQSLGPRPTGGFDGQQSHSAGVRPTGGRGGRGGFGQESGSLGPRPTGNFGQESQSLGPRPTGDFPQESGSLAPRPTGDFSQVSQSAGAVPTQTPVVKAAADSGSLPASSGTSTLAAAQTIAAGDSFDGGMYMIDRGASCTGQDEGGDSDAVFILEDGASLSNVIIGPNQIEGVHCRGACTLTNVWWSAVCEDAFTIKLQDDGETTTITGGGAFGADDKVLQHNGGGTLSVSDFYVEDFGKLYRSCGNCDDMPERHVIMDSITAVSGKTLVGINSNMGDTATLTNIVVSDVNDICVRYEGVTDGSEPEKLGSGPDSEACLYSESDITEA